jgi:hypothetical protein
MSHRRQSSAFYCPFIIINAKTESVWKTDETNKLHHKRFIISLTEMQ